MALLLLTPASAHAQEAAAGGLKLRVAEVARSVDLSRGREEFLTVTIEITGTDALRLRRVQPLRDDFQLRAGKTALPCRWLRGGSLPEDPARLRFTLGFSRPPAAVKAVDLVASLPRLDGEEVLDLALPDVRPDQVKSLDRKGPGWTLTLIDFKERDYVPPSLPPGGLFIGKGVPLDVRVFRKAGPKDAAPDRALVLRVSSPDVALYDATLDVSGHLTLEGAAQAPLLSASLRRFPSRTADRGDYPPRFEAEFHFPIPPRGRVEGVFLRLHRRPEKPQPQPLRIDGLPVP